MERGRQGKDLVPSSPWGHGSVHLCPVPAHDHSSHCNLPMGFPWHGTKGTQSDPVMATSPALSPHPSWLRPL